MFNLNFEINFDTSNHSALVLDNFILEGFEGNNLSVVSSPSMITVLTDITIKADDATGANGDNISIPIIVSDSVSPFSIEMLHFVLHYDINVLTFESISISGTQLDITEPTNDLFPPLNAITDAMELIPGVIGVFSFFPIERVTIHNGLLC
jgi:hypothetical protein